MTEKIYRLDRRPMSRGWISSLGPGTRVRIVNEERQGQYDCLVETIRGRKQFLHYKKFLVESSK